MELVVLFFTDPDSWNSRREFRGVFIDKATAEQWIERKHGRSLASDFWLQAAYVFETVAVIEGV